VVGRVKFHPPTLPILLYLPVASAPGMHTSFIDALFTATTSVCVTGLTTVSTAGNWSVFGKLVILLLIQLGGFGIITMSAIVIMVVGKRITLNERNRIRESYNLDSMSGLARLIRKIVAGTLLVEGIGMILYCFAFIPRFGVVKGIGASVFNSVSAFCNAGMDIMGDTSLAAYAKSPLVNFTTIGLIVMGGLGYMVWWDILHIWKRIAQKEIVWKKSWRYLNLNSKLVLSSTAILLAGGTAVIFLFENHNPGTMGDFNTGQTLMASFFQSVTCRTAGFFTIAQDQLRDASAMVCMLLMFIGGSPMGTAGGVKTTTIWVLVLTAATFLRGKKETEVFRRKVSDTYIRTALIVVLVSFSALFISTIGVTLVTNAPFLDIMYEMTSAVGTVGLSRGLTPNLSAAGKFIVILTMYVGRIGPVTLATAVTIQARRQTSNIHLPEEKILIG
jgi:trk system potassium uptake protein TrkH